MDLDFNSILITGGAGFLGSSLALWIKRIKPSCHVICLDNLIRKGSELQIPRLRQAGIEFVKADVRFPDKWQQINAECLVECSAEPSVQAGLNDSPEYLLNTNLMGAINCLEWARKKEAKFLFISTSRVYPVSLLNEIPLEETETRFQWCLPREHETYRTAQGLTMQAPLNGGFRSLYGTSKLSSEMLVEEYVNSYGLMASSIRFGVIAGPWQMGKVDQGFMAYWLAAHMYGQSLKYFGFGGNGKQVRDVLHVDDAVMAIGLVLKNLQSNQRLYQISGGLRCSVSLCELTEMAKDITGNTVPIEKIPETHRNDVPVILLDSRSSFDNLQWEPQYSVAEIVTDIHSWLVNHKDSLDSVFNSN